MTHPLSQSVYWPYLEAVVAHNLADITHHKSAHLLPADHHFHGIPYSIKQPIELVIESSEFIVPTNAAAKTGFKFDAESLKSVSAYGPRY